MKFIAVGAGVLLAVLAAGPSPAQTAPAENQQPSTPVQATSPPAQADQPAQQQHVAPQAAPLEVTPSEPLPPKGTVLFQSHGEPPLPSTTLSKAETSDVTASSVQATPKPDGPEFTDRERAAVLVTAYDLDARLTPASSGLEVRARVTLRNVGSAPLNVIGLQISSTLKWTSATLVEAGKRTPLSIAQHLLDTDADHTGAASELLLTLPAPLLPGTSLTFDTLYSGTITLSGDRLQRIGATAGQAAAADWDGISPNWTGLRGFGNVLWYPVSAPQLFLGDGAKLFQAIGQDRLKNRDTAFRLRIAVAYQGEPPVAIYFCGRRQPLVALSDDVDAPIASGVGIARAEFAEAKLGFREPSLFLVERPEALLAPLPVLISSSAADSSSSAPVADADGPPMLAVESEDVSAQALLTTSAESIAPLLEQWFGAHPASALTLLDHLGQPFQDGPFMVAPVAALGDADASPALANSMAQAWVQTGQPWMDEGLAEFAELLWVEHEKGRTAAIGLLNDVVRTLALAEPGFSAGPASDSEPKVNVESASKTELTVPSANPAQTAPGITTKAEPLPEPVSSTAPSADAASNPQPTTPATTSSVSPKVPVPSSPGQSLIAASDEVYYRRKAAAVWWMLRGIAGDEPVQQALSAWCSQPPAKESAEASALAFEKVLEKTSGKDLAWFFHDWVFNDMGLPDLSIVDVTPRLLPAGTNHGAGWLVAVTVRNEGAAAAEVPLIIRAGSFSTTQRLKIDGFSSATGRVIVEAVPSEVVVNDGSTPEVRVDVHSQTIVLKTD